MRTSGEQIWRNEKQKIEEVALKLQLENNIINEFTHFKRDFGFVIRLERDNGDIEHIEGWRVQHVNPYDTGRRPYKGGFMRGMSVSRELCRAKAAWMTWKCALIGPMEEERIPFGGAKGGLRCNPRHYSLREKRQQMEKVAKAINPIIGIAKDSLGPDAAVDAEDIRAFVTAYAELNQDKGIPCGAIATGKPLENCGGGCPGRLLATGRGMHYTYEALKKLLSSFAHLPKKPRALVQGFGNVGSAYVALAESFGITIVGVSDVLGGVYNASGIDAKELAEHNAKTGSVINFSEAETLKNGEFLHAPCDILVLAATEAVLTGANADGVQALIVLEGANGPTLPEAQQNLSERGIIVIPDILANAGGVTVSYFEWCQDMQGIFWTEKQINQLLKNYMIGGAKRTIRFAEEFNTDLRTGAYLAAFAHCAPAVRKKHGWTKSPQSLF